MKRKDTRGYPHRRYLPQPDASDNGTDGESSALLFATSVLVVYCVTVFMNTEVLWDVAYGLESLTLKTWKSNHLQMQWLENNNSFSLVILRP